MCRRFLFISEHVETRNDDVHVRSLYIIHDSIQYDDFTLPRRPLRHESLLLAASSRMINLAPLFHSGVCFFPALNTLSVLDSRLRRLTDSILGCASGIIWFWYLVSLGQGWFWNGSWETRAPRPYRGNGRKPFALKAPNNGQASKAL